MVLYFYFVFCFYFLVFHVLLFCLRILGFRLIIIGQSGHGSSCLIRDTTRDILIMSSTFCLDYILSLLLIFADVAMRRLPNTAKYFGLKLFHILNARNAFLRGIFGLPTRITKFSPKNAII